MQRRSSRLSTAGGGSQPTSRSSTPAKRSASVSKRAPAKRTPSAARTKSAVPERIVVLDSEGEEDELSTVEVQRPVRRTRSNGALLKVPDSVASGSTSPAASMNASSATSEAGEMVDTPATSVSSASFNTGLKNLAIEIPVVQSPTPSTSLRPTRRTSLRKSVSANNLPASKGKGKGKAIVKDEDAMDIDEVPGTDDDSELSDAPDEIASLSKKAKGKMKAVEPEATEPEDEDLSMDDEEDEFQPSEDDKPIISRRQSRVVTNKRRKVFHGLDESDDDVASLRTFLTDDKIIDMKDSIEQQMQQAIQNSLATAQSNAGESSSYVEEDEDDDDLDLNADADDLLASLSTPAANQRRRNRYLTGRRFVAMSRAERARARLVERHPIFEMIWTTLEKRPKPIPKQAEQPKGLSLKMMPFQLEGLNWMLNQEKGMYKGGILADEMGMGKTIQTIALLMSEPRKKPNLVVAPTVALMQWKSEIEKHTNKALSVIVFHGTNRPKSISEVEGYDVVMTTYSILESVYRKQQSGFKRKDGIVKEKSIIHKVKFHRVVLDEAHNIKDRTCNTAKSVFALQTTYKLCLSGTPLQNRIGEFFSLLRFLEIDPFAYYHCRECSCKQLHWAFTDRQHCDSCHHTPMSHVSFFNQEFLKPIQLHGHEGPGKEAMQRLHLLLSHIMLRRTKVERADDLGLPPRIVKIRRDFFNEEELDLYDSIYGSSKRKFDTYVAQGVVLNNYANIFTLITRMRQLADHPDLVLKRHTEGGTELPVCAICDEEAEEAIKSRCHHIFCRMCVQSYIAGYDGAGEDASPECPTCHVTLSIDLTQPSLESLSSQPTSKKNSIVSRIDMSNWRSSTKIEALVEELFKLRSRNHTIKSIVFSQFTNMLQLVEWRLKRAGFQTCMLEGSMSPIQRESVINHFMNNVQVEVFLVSLKAGGVALNLTEASQVFILDPWWNPSVEWQSGDRVHRIGQKRACKITRLVVEDSIESRIVELQEKKANLIRATVGGDQKSLERLTPADMQFLFN